MLMLDLAALQAAPLNRDPFEFLVVKSFLRPEALTAVRAAFPKITRAGRFPLSELGYGPVFTDLVEEIHGPEVEAAVAEKFGVDLSGHSLMITVRGRCQKKDGRIHTDTEWKILTALLCLNTEWQEEGGRLRLLRGPHDLDDMVAEVPRDGETLIAFRPSKNSYHGHKPYVGERRYVMLNWMATQAAARRELARHRLSARAKRFVRVLGRRRNAGPAPCPY